MDSPAHCSFCRGPDAGDSTLDASHFLSHHDVDLEAACHDAYPRTSAGSATAEDLYAAARRWVTRRDGQPLAPGLTAAAFLRDVVTNPTLTAEDAGWLVREFHDFLLRIMYGQDRQAGWAEAEDRLNVLWTKLRERLERPQGLSISDGLRTYLRTSAVNYVIDSNQKIGADGTVKRAPKTPEGRLRSRELVLDPSSARFTNVLEGQPLTAEASGELSDLPGSVRRHSSLDPAQAWLADALRLVLPRGGLELPEALVVPRVEQGKADCDGKKPDEWLAQLEGWKTLVREVAARSRGGAGIPGERFSRDSAFVIGALLREAAHAFCGDAAVDGLWSVPVKKPGVVDSHSVEDVDYEPFVAERGRGGRAKRSRVERRQDVEGLAAVIERELPADGRKAQRMRRGLRQLGRLSEDSG